MARSRKLIRNPSIPRLEWVAKTYPESVWYYTVSGFMQAVGMDDDEMTLEDEARRTWLVSGRERALGGRGLTLPEALSSGVNNMIIAAGFESTQYDKYIPWLAKRIHGASKGPLKKIKKIVEKAHPGLIYEHGHTFTLEEFADDSGVTQAGVDRINLGVEMGVGLFGIMDADADDLLEQVINTLHDQGDSEALRLANDLEDEVAELVLAFGSIARWANDTGVNLDDYSIADATRESTLWARTRPKDMDVVGGDVVYEFGDGWTFQELKTGAQLRCEGEYLDHCVDGYKPSKIGVVYRIFSLRTPDGLPVATMQWSVPKEYVVQYYGMSNRIPERDEVERAVQFRLNYIDKNLILQDEADATREARFWTRWKKDHTDTGGWWDGNDGLLVHMEGKGIDPSAVPNPRKKRKKTPEYKRLLNRSYRLWETYDAKPLKKNLLAFGAHVERMKKSESLKVKTEARRAARAFNAEFRARGWKKKGKKGA